jgi:hypothetical protein
MPARTGSLPSAHIWQINGELWRPHSNPVEREYHFETMLVAAMSVTDCKIGDPWREPAKIFPE